MLDKIREVIEMHDSLVEFKGGKEHCILPEHYDELSKDIVKKLTIPDVVKSLPQDNYCNVCNLPTDGKKCYSKRCPV